MKSAEASSGIGTARATSFALDQLEIREIGLIQVLIEAGRRYKHRWRHALPYLRLRGWKATTQRILRELRPHNRKDYETWLRRYDTLSEADLAAIRAHIRGLASKPLISVIMPTHNTSAAYLRCALDSVRDQLYPHWELCIADDASTEPHVLEIIQEYARSDDRIKVAVRRHTGHAAVAGNSALELATGDHVAFLDQNDVLSRHALYMVAVELNEHPDAEIVYTDEDKVGDDGNRHDPHFKSSWNPDLFHAQNMLNHLGVYRTSTVRAIGGFRAGYEGSQDYDLALRTVARTAPDRIRHIPHVLYHWRMHPGSGSSLPGHSPEAGEAAKRALADFFGARREQVEIVDTDAGCRHVVRPLPSPLPGVSLVVPTRDRVDLLRRCVEGLLHGTEYPNVEVIVVDNDSVEAETIDYLTTIGADPRVTVASYSGAFNFSAMTNVGVAHATREILGFINNDIVVKNSNWLSQMVRHVIRPEVGAVGAKLLYANDTVQHGGVITGIGGVAGHAHRHFPADADGYFGRLRLTQNMSCVTAACMLTRSAVFQEVGSLDEINLPVTFNDVDLCLRIREHGYMIVWAAEAELYHLEAASRGSDLVMGTVPRHRREIAYMMQRWGDTLANDPYYNPNLTLVAEDYGLAFPPRVRKPWLCSKPGSLHSSSTESDVASHGRGG